MLIQGCIKFFSRGGKKSKIQRRGREGKGEEKGEGKGKEKEKGKEKGKEKVGKKGEKREG